MQAIGGRMGEGIRSLLSRPALRAVAGAVLAALIVLAMALIWQSRDRPTVIINVQHLDDPSLVSVYVGGAVNHPGIVTLERGSRIADALAAAGGTTSEADTSQLGLAAVLQDSQQIIVATKIARAQPTTAASGDATAIPTPRTLIGDTTSSGATATPVPSSTDSGLIDLNLATTTELEELPGIGPAIAQRIVDRRVVEGPYQTIDELESIQGISARMVEELRPLLTIGS